MARYTFFKPSGKYYSDAEGVDVPITGDVTTRESLMALNNGIMPGLRTRAAGFFIVITDDETSYPRLLHPEDLS